MASASFLVSPGAATSAKKCAKRGAGPKKFNLALVYFRRGITPAFQVYDQEQANTVYQTKPCGGTQNKW